MYDRDRLAPIALTVERPVLHLVLNALFADAALGEEGKHFGNGFLLGLDTVEKVRIDHFAVSGVGFLFGVAAADHGNDLDAEFLGKIEVALIVRRHCHNGARAVAHHHIVRNENGDLAVVDRIDRRQTVDAHARLVLDQLGALKFGLFGAFRTVGVQFADVADAVAVFFDHRMLGRYDHEGHAEHGVGTRGVDPQSVVGARYGKFGKCALGASDPVFLLQTDIGKIVHGIQSGKELIGIPGDAEIPDVLGFLHDIAVTDIALATLRILVGQHHLTARAVVHQRGGAEHQTVVEHFAENPLRPLVVALFGGINDAAPIEGEADALELRGEPCDVDIGHTAGMDAGLDSVVFGGKSVCIKADGEQDVAALHSAFPRNNLKAGICLDVPHVHTCARGIRKLDQTVKLRLGVVFFCDERLLFVPDLLPFGVDPLKIVLHGISVPFVSPAQAGRRYPFHLT